MRTTRPTAALGNARGFSLLFYGCFTVVLMCFTRGARRLKFYRPGRRATNAKLTRVRLARILSGQRRTTQPIHFVKCTRGRTGRRFGIPSRRWAAPIQFTQPTVACSSSAGRLGLKCCATTQKKQWRLSFKRIFFQTRGGIFAKSGSDLVGLTRRGPDSPRKGARFSKKKRLPIEDRTRS